MPIPVMYSCFLSSHAAAGQLILNWTGLFVVFDKAVRALIYKRWLYRQGLGLWTLSMVLLSMWVDWCFPSPSFIFPAVDPWAELSNPASSSRTLGRTVLSSATWALDSSSSFASLNKRIKVRMFVHRGTFKWKRSDWERYPEYITSPTPTAAKAT